MGRARRRLESESSAGMCCYCFQGRRAGRQVPPQTEKQESRRTADAPRRRRVATQAAPDATGASLRVRRLNVFLASLGRVKVIATADIGQGSASKPVGGR